MDFLKNIIEENKNISKLKKLSYLLNKKKGYEILKSKNPLSTISSNCFLKKCGSVYDFLPKTTNSNFSHFKTFK